MKKEIYKYQISKLIPNGFEPLHTFDNGNILSRADLIIIPNAKGLTAEEVKKFINENYPQPEIDF